MGNLNPILRESADFKHKLWDHLFIMSDFDLDVDSPYPIPTAKSLYPKPDRIEYPKHQIARKHYGKNIENMLAALKEIDDEEAKTQIAGQHSQIHARQILRVQSGASQQRGYHERHTLDVR